MLTLSLKGHMHGLILGQPQFASPSVFTGMLASGFLQKLKVQSFHCSSGVAVATTSMLPVFDLLAICVFWLLAG